MRWFLFIFIFISLSLHSQAPCEFKFGDLRGNFSLNSKVVGVCFDDTVVVNDCVNILRNYFGFKCNSTNAYLGLEKFSTNNVLFLNILLPRIYNDTLTIYIVSYDLIYIDIYVKGISGNKNSTIFIDGRRPDYRSTLIHEIGHQLGLDHCEDSCCVMFSGECIGDSQRFCIRCLRLLGQ